MPYDPTQGVHPDQYYRQTPSPAGCQDPLACGLCDWFCPNCQAVEDAYQRDVAAYEQTRRERKEALALASKMAAALRHHEGVLRDPIVETVAESVGRIVAGLTAKEARRER